MKKVIFDYAGGRCEEFRLSDEVVQVLIDWAGNNDRIKDGMIVFTYKDISILKDMLRWREKFINDIEPIGKFIHNKYPNSPKDIDGCVLELIQTVKKIKKEKNTLSIFYDNLKSYPDLKIWIVLDKDIDFMNYWENLVEKEVNMKSRFIEGVKEFMKDIDSLIFTWVSPFLILLEVLETFKGRRGL